jgi:hypothetical protein
MKRDISYASINLRDDEAMPDMGHTFKPKINKKSQMIVRNSKIEEILSIDAKRRQNILAQK